MVVQLFSHRNLMCICHISAAIATVVTIAEILKNNGLAVEKSETLSCFSCDFIIDHEQFFSLILSTWKGNDEYFLC